MIRNILVGLDGSLYSQTAMAVGIQWARRTAAVLTGLAIVDEPTICRAVPTPIAGGTYKVRRDEALLRDARRQVDGFLEQFTNRCREAGVNCRVLRATGLPSEKILAEAEDFDLTFLGQYTHYHFETQLTADETRDVVLRRSRRPVVTVPGRLPVSSSVVVAYDASPPATRALEAFQRSGLYEGQSVHVLSIARDREVAARHAEEGARFLRYHEIPARALPLTTPRGADKRLLAHIRELDAGMVVMGVYGGSRFWDALLGSTTRTILEQTETLLFLHP
jgi:nucleotide-binding universal stress UspA family protein